MKNKILYQTGLLCGLIPLIVGLSIFFTWCVARVYCAVDLDNFEVYGFMWILISIPTGFLGLLLMTIFLFQNFKEYLRQSILGILLILLNLPVCDWVITKQVEIDKFAFFKIENMTNKDNLKLTLKTTSFSKQLKTIDNNKSTVDFYFPKYIDQRGDSSYPTTEKATLIVKDEFSTYYLPMPRINRGDCIQLSIDKEFKLNNKSNINEITKTRP